jgi:ammonium transporter, Amt family
MTKLRYLIFTLAFAGLAAAQQAAQTADEKIAALQAAVASAQMAGDNAWMLTSSALVLLMTGPALALFYSGLVRRKNVLGTMMQSFILMAIVSVLWYLVGYSLAFGEGNAFIGDFRYVMLNGVGADPMGDYAATIPHLTWMVYQLMFAIITPGLICGAYAERMKFSGMVLFSSLWLLVVYCPMAHMVWGKGGYFNAFLGGVVPAYDFAGGTVVHITSGVSALICALVLGPRKGFGKEPMKPHSLVLSFIGACMLWVGWFGFNAGSALAAGALASSAFVATHFGAAAATLGWLIGEKIHSGKPSVLGGISGAVAGLVAITPASGFVTPGSALIIGLIAGFFCFFMCAIVKNMFGYDDSLDAFGVHGMGGTLGAILTGVFATSVINSAGPAMKGLVDGNPGQIVNQLMATGAAWVLGAVGTFVLLKVTDMITGIRVTAEEEQDGLDISMHGEEGYSLES